MNYISMRGQVAEKLDPVCPERLDPDQYQTGSEILDRTDHREVTLPKFLWYGMLFDSTASL